MPIGFAISLGPAIQGPAAEGQPEVKHAGGTHLFRQGSSHVLVIRAVDDKHSFWKTLHNLQQMASDFRQVLNRQGSKLEMVANPDSIRLKSSIDSFIKRYGFAYYIRLLICFAGHRWTRNNALGYLVAVDAPANDRVEGDLAFATSALSMEQVMSWARQMEARHVLFMFNSCVSGAMFKVRSASPLPTYPQRQISMPVRQFITAGDVHAEVPAKRLFTPLLIRALDGAADINGDGSITDAELGSNLPRAMASHSTSQKSQEAGSVIRAASKATRCSDPPAHRASLFLSWSPGHPPHLHRLQPHPLCRSERSGTLFPQQQRPYQCGTDPRQGHSAPHGPRSVSRRRSA
ncbi:hypothetical protein [Synechococcus sp. CCY 9618]|uniref:hypothetical protein n=1 Tax=Synechococcus sp. CCY 9618 TaxID=2815602 RepID=UPI001C23FC42|nr:hypothetical protein [Synechococcus sp. CCY 9618]